MTDREADQRPDDRVLQEVVARSDTGFREPAGVACKVLPAAAAEPAGAD
jgi:hypothetical protein